MFHLWNWLGNCFSARSRSPQVKNVETDPKPSHGCQTQTRRRCIHCKEKETWSKREKEDRSKTCWTWTDPKWDGPSTDVMRHWLVSSVDEASNSRTCLWPSWRNTPTQPFIFFKGSTLFLHLKSVFTVDKGSGLGHLIICMVKTTPSPSEL